MNIRIIMESTPEMNNVHEVQQQMNNLGNVIHGSTDFKGGE